MRGKQAPKRTFLPDAKYGSIEIARFINYVMVSGKKSIAQTIVYGALAAAEAKTNRKPVEVFEEAMKNITPQVEVRSQRVGGANYQVPMPVRPERRMALAYRWLIEAARKKKGRAMVEKLAEELILASVGEGDAVKKKMDVHRMAEANRAFAHFARF